MKSCHSLLSWLWWARQPLATFRQSPWQALTRGMPLHVPHWLIFISALPQLGVTFTCRAPGEVVVSGGSVNHSLTRHGGGSGERRTCLLA